MFGNKSKLKMDLSVNLFHEDENFNANINVLRIRPEPNPDELPNFSNLIFSHFTVRLWSSIASLSCFSYTGMFWKSLFVKVI